MKKKETQTEGMFQHTKLPFFSNAYQKCKEKDLTPEYIFNFIKKPDDDFKKKIEEIRNSTVKDQQQDLKKQLPAVVWSTNCSSEGRSKKHCDNITGLVCIDFDKISTDEYDEIWNWFTNDSHTMACFKSPRCGMKVVVKTLCFTQKGEAYKDTHSGIIKYYVDNGFEKWIDKGTNDITRLCFLSYDPDIHVNWSSEPFPVIINNEGERNNLVFSNSREALSRGFSGEELSKYTSTTLPIDEAKKSISNAQNYIGNNENEKGSEKRTTREKEEYYTRVLKEAFDFTHDVIKDVICFKRKGEEKTSLLGSNNKSYQNLYHETRLLNIADDKAVYRIVNGTDICIKVDKRDDFKREIEKILPERCLQAWCDLIELLNWDDTDIILLKDWVNRSYHAWSRTKYSGKVFVNDKMLLLTGKQGVGKSIFTKWLCPLMLKDYAALPFTGKDKLDFNRAAVQNVFCLLDEFDIKPKGVVDFNNAFKEILTESEVSYIPKYEENMKKCERKAVFVGSTNNKTPLVDNENRRFEIINMKEKIDLGRLLEMDVMPIYAYFYHFPDNPIERDAEIKRLIDKRNESYKEVPVFIEAFNMLYERDDNASFVLLTDIKKVIESSYSNCKIEDKENKELAKYIRQKGVVESTLQRRVVFRVSRKDVDI